MKRDLNERRLEDLAYARTLQKKLTKTNRSAVEIGRADYAKVSALAAITVGRPSVDRYVQMLIENDWELWHGRNDKHDIGKRSEDLPQG